MRPDTVQLRLIAAWLFSAGLVLVGSGWGPALSGLLGGRPVWSVCGLVLCECRPAEMPDDCPLCQAGQTGDDRSCSRAVTADPTRALLHETPGKSAVNRLENAGQSLLIGFFMLGLSATRADAVPPQRGGPAEGVFTRPGSVAGEVPVPPPRHRA